MQNREPLHPLYATFDHIVGLGHGGQNHPLNKLLAHRICNETRGSVARELVGIPDGMNLREFHQQQLLRLQKIADQGTCGTRSNQS